jgi:hypothetical protein
VPSETGKCKSSDITATGRVSHDTSYFCVIKLTTLIGGYCYRHRRLVPYICLHHYLHHHLMSRLRTRLCHRRRDDTDLQRSTNRHSHCRGR